MGSRQRNGQSKSLVQEDIDAEELKAQFNDVFSLRKPKDAKAGLSSGAKSIGKGVLAGAVGLVATPVLMAREEGIKGFAKGVGAGDAPLRRRTVSAVLLWTIVHVDGNTSM